MFLRLVAFSLVIAGAVSCSEKQSVNEISTQEEPIEDVENIVDALAAEALTSEGIDPALEKVRYSVLSDESLRTAKRSVVVRPAPLRRQKRCITPSA